MKWRTFQKKEKEEFPLHFTPFAPQFPSNVQSQSQNSWPSLPDEAYLPEPQESQDFLKDGPIFSYFLPFFTELFGFWASQRLVPCRARANVCHHDGEGHGIFLQVVREPWPQLYSIEPPWRWLEMNHDQIRPNLGVCFRVCFLASFFELFNF